MVDFARRGDKGEEIWALGTLYGDMKIAEQVDGQWDFQYAIGPAVFSYLVGRGWVGQGDVFKVEGTPSKYFGRTLEPVDPGTGERLPEVARAKQEETTRVQEERYEEMLDINQRLRGRITGGIESYGAQQEADIRSTYRDLNAENYGNLVGRGFAGTTIVPALEQANVRAQTADLSRAREARVNVGRVWDYDLASQQLGIMGERVDEYPQLEPYLAMSQMQGRYPYPYQVGRV